MVQHRLVVAGLCLLLVTAAIVVTQTAVPAETPPEPTVRWVRTKHGWQPADWEQVRTPRRPALHPLVVASFISLASILALLGCSNCGRESQGPDAGDENSSMATG